MRGDQQLFLGPTAALFFDHDGNLARVEDIRLYPVPKPWRELRDYYAVAADCGEAWPEELGFEEEVIQVKRFCLPDRWMSIEDMPDILAEFYTDPERFDLDPDAVEAWKAADQYVLHAGCGDFYMNSEGGVEAS